MKKNEKENPRRTFMRNLYRTCILVAGPIAFTGCGKKEEKKEDAKIALNPEDPCGDLSNVREEDIAVRQKFGYVKESPLPDNQCLNCNLYLPPKSGEPCGGCMLFKGPVYAEAYCTYWAPKV